MRIGTILIIDCEHISISFLNISNSQNEIHDFFIYTTPIVIFYLNITNVTISNSELILMVVNCSLNLSGSFISRISNKFLLSYMSQINISNSIFLNNFMDYEAPINNFGGNGISLQMESEFHIENTSFISLYQRNPGPVQN